MKKWILMVFFAVLLMPLMLTLAGCGGGGGGARGESANPALDTLRNKIKDAGAEWEPGENEITQLTDEQKQELNGADEETATDVVRIAPRNMLASTQLPTYIDWRSNTGNFLSTIKNQGQCGSCVAHASLAVVESLMKISDNSTSLDPDLSESDLFSCGGAKCANGWYLSSAADRLMKTGVVDEACLPYQAKDNVCSLKCANASSRLIKIASWNWLPANDVAAMKNALLAAPLLATIDVYEDFYYYKSGVYTHVSGAYQGGHAIAIVGYDDRIQSWIVKNSWGTSWGESGYVKIKYGQVNIEKYALAMQMVEQPLSITATATPTSLDVAGTKKTTLTCSTTGKVTSLDIRCHNTSSWTSWTVGAGAVCTYSGAGTFYPGCRVNGTLSDDVDTAVVVGSPIAVTASATPSTGDVSTIFVLKCGASGGTVTSLEGRCSSGDVWKTVNATDKTVRCTYTGAGSFIPTCRANGTITKDVSSPVTVSATKMFVTPSVTPTAGTIHDSYTLTCTASSGTVTSLEGRCNTNGAWTKISSGKTMTCNYSAAGSYKPGCRVNSSTSTDLSKAVAVTKPAFTATVTPAKGTTYDSYTLTCGITGGTTTNLESRCSASDSWAKITSGKTRVCTYSAAGSYKPGCRFYGTQIKDVTTAIAVTKPTVAATVSPAGGSVNETYKVTCAVSGGTAKTLESRCTSTAAWKKISSGTSANCTYTTAGSYTPGCRLNSDQIANTAAITVTKPTVTASVNPTLAPVSTTFKLTCTSAGGKTKSLESRCKSNEAWKAAKSGTAVSCKYTATGSYTAGCRVDGTTISEKTLTVK